MCVCKCVRVQEYVLAFDDHSAILRVTEGLETLAQHALGDTAGQVVNVEHTALILRKDTHTQSN